MIRISRLDGVMIIFVVLLVSILSGTAVGMSLDEDFNKDYASITSFFTGETTSEINGENLINNGAESYLQFNDTLSSKIDSALSNKMPVFVFFYADWCSFSQQEKSIINQLEHEYAGKIAFMHVNVEEDITSVNMFNVSGYPSMFLIINKSTEENYVYKDFRGFRDKKILKESFDYVIENDSLPKDSRKYSSIGLEPVIAKIGPEGGMIAVGNEISLFISEGALSNDTEISIQPIINYEPKSKDYIDNYHPIIAYSLKPNGLVFGKPITFTLRYPDGLNKLDPNIEENLSFHLFNDEGTKYETYSSVINKEKSIITAQINHFSVSIISINIPLFKKCNTDRDCNPEYKYFCIYENLLRSQGTCQDILTLGILDKIPIGITLYKACVWGWPFGGSTFKKCNDQDVAQCYGDLAVYEDVDCEGPEPALNGPSFSNNGPQAECKTVRKNSVDCNKYDKTYCSGDDLIFDDYYCDIETYDHGSVLGMGPVKKYCSYERKISGKCEPDEPPPSPGGDHPDDNYDLASYETILTLDSRMKPEVAVLNKGFPISVQKFLADNKEPVYFIDPDFSQDLMKDFPVLIVPSGGLYGLDSSPTFKGKLDKYVKNGGTLIVFSQQHGYDFGAIPGNLSGFGWLEDQSCQYSSVAIANYHTILSGQKSEKLSINVDGYFTKYPENATVLLTRTKNGMPAMLIYEYGNGTIIATSAYMDWAYGRGHSTKDEIRFVRDMVAWAKNPKDIEEYGTNDFVNVSINVTNSYLLTPQMKYPQFELGETVNISANITNYANLTSDKIHFAVFGPNNNKSFINISESIHPNETKEIIFTYQTEDSSKNGTYNIYSFLTANYTLIGGEYLGGFNLGINISDKNIYKVNLTLRDPDKEIIKQETKFISVPMEQTKTLNYTYSTPSKLGIWYLQYDILDTNDTKIWSGVERFAVSKFKDNPDGFIYSGSEISFAITSDAERYPYGSPAVFTFHIWNRGSTDKDIKVTWGSIHHSWYGIIPPGWDNALSETITVPGEGYASFTYVLPKVVDLDRFRARFYDGSTYLGSAEKGFWMFRPSLGVSIQTDKTEYAKGENGTISLNIKNMQSSAYNTTIVVRVLNPENYKIFEKTFDLNIAASSTEDRNIEFSIPGNDVDGVHLVTADAYRGTNKIGSNSTFFKVSKNYMVRLDFDNPSKTYRIRQNMGMDVSLINTAASALSTHVNVSIPDVNFNDSKNITVDANQTEKIHYDVLLPEDLSPGKHSVIVTVGIDNSEKEYNFFIPDSKLTLGLDKLNYNTGDDVLINLSNIGGVDSGYNYSIKLLDPYNAEIYNNSGEESLLTGETKVIQFRIPGGIISGSYRLIIRGKDVKTNESVSLWKNLYIEGFNTVLTTSTDRKGYFVDENISVLTNVTNLNYDIEEGTLNLKIYSSGQITSMRADSKGKEFFLVNTENYYGGYESAIFITSEVDTSGIVEIPGIGFSRSFTVEANQIISINVPVNSMVSGSDRIENKGIRVSADADVAVYLLNPGVPVYTNDAFLGLPTDILDKEYIVLTYNSLGSYYPSEIAITAPYNDTLITITPSVTTGSKTANVPYTVQLDQLQTYTLQSDSSYEDLTGTLIQANQPIAVFAGVKCVNIPQGYGACDHIVEQLTPVSTWGKNIDAFQFKPRQYNRGDFLRILASVDDTIVTINDAVAGTLNTGEFFETTLKGPVEISASEPVLVAQYMTGLQYEGRIGDPAFSLVTPVEQFLSEYTFLVPTGYAENYINVIAPSSSLDNLLLDSAPVDVNDFISYGTKGFSAGTISLSQGSHTIRGSEPFGLYGYGYNQYVSYAYPGGLALRTLRGTLVWEKNIKLNLSKSEVKNLVDTIDISKEMPNLVGKFDLIASLYSNSSQKINQSDVYSFFITDKNTSFTMETDKKLYKPGESITVYGTVQNNEDSVITYNLSLKAKDAVIFSDTFTLDAGETHDFSTDTTSDKSFTLEGTVDGITITEFIKIEPPVINVTVNSPDIVDRKEFDAGVLIENTGNVPVDLTIGMNNTFWNITISEKESEYLETKMKINKNTTFNITISGDVNQIIQKEIVLGERAEINITTQSMYFEGTVDIPFKIRNTGIFDSEFNATFSIGNKTVKKAIYVPKGETTNDSISFNLSKGKYLLEYASPFEKGNVTINVETGAEFIVTAVPSNLTLTIGQSATIDFRVKNTGGVEGNAEIHLTIPGIFEDINNTWIALNTEDNITFNFVIPDDLEEKNYKVFYELDGKKAETSLFVQGAKIEVNGSLDKKMYVEGDTAVLVIEVKNIRNIDLELFSRVKFNEYDSVQNFNLTGLETKTLSFNVPVQFNGDSKIFYSVYMASGRSLYINSIYVYEKRAEDGGIILYTDKQVYVTGEHVKVFVDVTKDGTLNLTAPGFTTTKSLITGDSAVISFKVPELKSGTYYIDYTFDNFKSSYPFDVNGYSTRILEFNLDKELYNPGDNMNMEMLAEVNRDFSGTVKMRLYGKDAEDSFEFNREFVTGENKIKTNRVLTTGWSGIHSVVYGIYVDLEGSSTLLASGAEYFDVVDHVPPLITITSPQNIEYIMSSVPLVFTIEDTSDIEWIGYSLDGAENVTISGSTNLKDLTNNLHTIVLYAKDSAGNIGSKSVAFTMNTRQLDITPPVITNVAALPDATSAITTWETDEASNSTVMCGISPGIYPITDSDTGMVLSHSITLTGLNPDTLYYYVASSSDTQGNTAETTEFTFRTLALPDTEAPVIDSAFLYPAIAAPGSTIDIRVTASDNTGVQEVTADGTPLTLNPDGVWEGTITASSSTGNYQIPITASDEVSNSAETALSYSVVIPAGGISVTSTPKPLVLPSGTSGELFIKLTSTANFDDTVEVTLDNSGLPPAYAADLNWFNRTGALVQVPAGETVLVPFTVDIPSGVSPGYRTFTDSARSLGLDATSMDTGVIYVTS